MSETISIARPKRWDHPFCAESSDHVRLSEAGIDELLSKPPFEELDVAGFRKSLPFSDILKNDARIVHCEPGDIVVRRNDWGNSAFFLIEGQLRVELESPGNAIPTSIAGDDRHQKKSLFQSIAQLWGNSVDPERRSFSEEKESQVAARLQGSKTRIFLQDVPAILNEYKTGVIEAGQWFGELAALGRTPRTATVFAESSAKILEIRWQGLRDIMRFDKNKAINQQIESAFRQHALEEFLRNDPMFQGLTSEKINRLMESVEFQTYGEYGSPKPFKELAKQGIQNNFENEALICEQGNYPNAVFMIRSGLARLTVKHHHGERTVGYLAPGQSYGLSEITEGAGQDDAIPYLHSLRAISYLSAILIPTPVVEDVLLSENSTPVSHSKNSKEQTYTFKVQEATGTESIFNFLVEDKYIQGRQTMVIDMDRCVRCDDCVKACADAHDNNPRFIRHGPIHGQHMIANACLHCADPVCMVECPTGAIHTDFDSGLVLINEQTCIGCAQCANNCPYDAIRMVQISDEHGRQIVDQKSQLPLIQATKCDLCIDQLGGPACQSACSHDALKRVNMNDIHALEELLT